MKPDELTHTQRSPIRLFITIIIAIFMAEVVAMIVVYLIQPIPYFQVTFIDAGIMTALIFPVLYYLSFRPLLRHIEERREVEDSLLQSRQLQERFFNSIDTLIAYMDRDFNFIRVNDAYARADGRQPDFFPGKNHFNLYPHPENQAIFQRVVETGEAYWVYEKPFEYPEHPERGVLYWDWRLQPVKGADGTVAGLVLSLLNVTERKRAAESIRESEEKFRTLAEWTYDWEFWVDPLGKLLYTSPSCKRITGFGPEEFVADPELMISIIHAKDRPGYLKHQEAIHSRSATVEKTEFRIITRDGTECWIEHICRPLFGSQEEYLGRRVSNRDITQRKQAEKAIQERDQKEKLLTQTIHTMQLDIARDLHDTLGQNISFLRMKLDHLAEKKMTRRSEMQLEIRSMARAADESYDLMRGTLAVLQSENSTDLFRLFTRYAEQIEERSTFEIKSQSEGEPRFMSAKRMRQLFYIFREILNNIEKHARATEVTMEMRWEADCLHLIVSDNGSGFEIGKAQYGGHYGLKFMRDRAELLNGSLIIQSAVGSGTQIRLEVPYE